MLGVAGTARTPLIFLCVTLSMSMLAVNAQAYSFEAGNVRHEHEWTVWEDAALPERQIHFAWRGQPCHQRSVEHPELVAQRILRFTNILGRERVVASTDCGLGGRVHHSDRLGKT